MTATINASTSSGIVTSADTSGALALQSNGTTKLTVDSTGAYGQLVSGTAVASTSGTSIDFTGIPSWVKRITVMFNNVSTSGTSNIQIQIGAGSVDTSGYTCTYGVGNGSGVATTGFVVTWTTAASYLRTGTAVINLISSNAWVETSMLGDYSNAVVASFSQGYKSLSGTLDRVRITTVNGTDTFDLGSINILYEG